MDSTFRTAHPSIKRTTRFRHPPSTSEKESPSPRAKIAIAALDAFQSGRFWLPEKSDGAIQTRLEAIAEQRGGSIVLKDVVDAFATLAPRAYGLATMYRFLRRHGWQRDWTWKRESHPIKSTIKCRNIGAYVESMVGKRVSRATAYRYMRDNGWRNSMEWRPRC